MKGLQEYIRRHGRHFTVGLVMDIMDCKWDAKEVREATDRVAYYNVSGATLGDMVFWFNLFAHDLSKRGCLGYCLEMVGNVEAEGMAFNAWAASDDDIDLARYT